jgi:hypothetical protein
MSYGNGMNDRMNTERKIGMAGIQSGGRETHGWGGGSRNVFACPLVNVHMLLFAELLVFKRLPKAAK